MENRTARLARLLDVAAAAGVVALAPLVLARSVGWSYPLELLSHFQVPYLLAALSCTVVLAARRRFRWMLAAALCAILPASAVLPFLPEVTTGRAYAAPAGTSTNLRILHANVLCRNRQYESVVELIRASDADLVVLQEVNRRWMRAIDDVRSVYPYMASGPREDNFGIAVLSRVPFEAQRVELLGEAELPTLVLTVDADGAPLTVVTTHPKPPIDPDQFRMRNDQLTMVGHLLDDLPRPLVVVGDLNTTMWSPWYRRLTRPNGLLNVRRGLGVRASWPTWLPAALRVPIDHCLVSPDIAVADCRLGPEIGSDHRPLIVDLRVPTSSSAPSSSR